MWYLNGPLKIRELGVNHYQFVFENQHAKMRVLNGRAWTFDSQFIILKPWKEEWDSQTDSFNWVHLWVQVWNLPNHWISRETDLKFKNLFGEVIDVVVPESDSKKGRYLKVVAEIDRKKQLIRGTKIKFQGQTVWVAFKYENLAMFCFYCGKVGHSKRMCTRRRNDAKAGNLLEGQYGEWLKMDPIRPATKHNDDTGKEKLGGIEGREREGVPTQLGRGIEMGESTSEGLINTTVGKGVTRGRNVVGEREGAMGRGVVEMIQDLPEDKAEGRITEGVLVLETDGKTEVRPEGEVLLDQEIENAAAIVDQGIVLPVIETLINIPIEIPEVSGSLKEITNF